MSRAGRSFRETTDSAAPKVPANGAKREVERDQGLAYTFARDFAAVLLALNGYTEEFARAHLLANGCIKVVPLGQL